jgi:hypothetical protein
MRPLDCAKKQWNILANRLYIVCSNADQSPQERRIISESLYNRRMISAADRGWNDCMLPRAITNWKVSVTSISRSQWASGRLSTVNYRLFPIRYCNNNIIGSNMPLNYEVFIWSHISLRDVHQKCYYWELRVPFFGSLHGTFRSLCLVWTCH